MSAKAFFLGFLYTTYVAFEIPKLITILNFNLDKVIVMSIMEGHLIVSRSSHLWLAAHALTAFVVVAMNFIHHPITFNYNPKIAWVVPYVIFILQIFPNNDVLSDMPSWMAKLIHYIFIAMMLYTLHFVCGSEGRNRDALFIVTTFPILRDLITCFQLYHLTGEISTWVICSYFAAIVYAVSYFQG